MSDIVVKVDGIESQTAEALLAIADKYEVTDLVELAEQQLIASMASGNAIHLLQFADMHHRPALKTAALDVMVANSATVFRRSDLPSVLGEVLCGEVFAFLASNCSVKSKIPSKDPEFVAKSGHKPAVVNDLVNNHIIPPESESDSESSSSESESDSDTGSENSD
eukprot:gene25843-32340_t